MCGGIGRYVWGVGTLGLGGVGTLGEGGTYVGGGGVGTRG